MKSWLRRWLVAGTTLLVGLLFVTSCSPTVEEPEVTESSPAASAQNEEPAPSAAEPYVIPDGPISIEAVPAITPLDASTPAQLPVTVTDATGAEVTITDTSRTLALDIYGTFAETIIALGEGDKIVGRSSSNTQEELADLPLVTVGGHQLNAEAILSLQPTLVLADKTLGPPEVMDQLADAGVTVVYLDADRSLATMPDMIQDIGEIMGVSERGTELSAQISDRLDEVTAEIDAMEPASGEVPSALFLYMRGTGSIFFIFGEGSGADDLISSLGLRDVASEHGVSDNRPATAEALAELAPDIIFVMNSGLESGGGVDELLARPGMAQTPAGENRRIIDLPDGQSLSFGPSYPDLVAKTAEALFGNTGE